jgi:uncharacterized protein YecE (DUF72 family)
MILFLGIESFEAISLSFCKSSSGKVLVNVVIEQKDLKKWKDITPDDFRFTLKANRFFTHQKKLNIDDTFKERFDTFMELAKGMEEKLGCILWQLPGNLHKNVEKLEELFELTGKNKFHVFEFRHESWFDDEIFDVLSENNGTFCMLSAPDDLPETLKTTSKAAYLRLHGKDEWYNYNYSEKELKEWKSRLDDLKNTDELFVYFNNDQHANAPQNAKTLKSFFK